MRDGEISIGGRLHPSGRWITFPLQVAAAETLWMVLDTGSPVSALSPRTTAELQDRGLVRPLQPNRYLLGGLTMGGRPLAGLVVGAVRRLERLQIEGLLGLDFLAAFEESHFHVPTLRLTLSPPVHAS